MRTSSLVVLLPLGLAVVVSLLLVREQSGSAMTHAEPGDDLASLKAKTIANFKAECRGKKKDLHEDIKVQTSWPRGVYGLPMPTSGCSTDSGFTWKNGSRLHDTENSVPSNGWSKGLHLKGPYAKNDMCQHFCMKTVDRVGENDAVWPNGEYCVFKFGENCPIGMSSGSIFWDDENKKNHNSVDGTVPTRVYDHNTLINYCCMTNGMASDPITLPSYSPFYLFAYIAQCQEVKGMNVTRERFKWDDEDGNNADYSDGSHPYDTEKSWQGHILNYCYYN